MSIILNNQQTKTVNSIRDYIGDVPALASDFGIKPISEPSIAGTHTIQNMDIFNIDWNDVSKTKKERERDEFKDLPRESQNKYNFLIMGPGGSGKTTVVINAFNNSNLKIAFCAFTNKATQVLSNIADKFNLTFQADFMTIHKFYMLKPRYLSNEKEVAFSFDRNQLEHLKNYDVIIFDECSTISKELYSYIQQAWEMIYFKHNKCLKHVFLGDYWQLPPVGENKSMVFSEAINNQWTVAKLNKVMRSKNSIISNVNKELLKWVTIFKKKKKSKLAHFHLRYPFNLLDPKKYCLYIGNLREFYDLFMEGWNNDPDIVILSYSRANCHKTNQAIQDMVDIKFGRDPPDEREKVTFYSGDRCCIDRPIEVCKIERFVRSNNVYAQLSLSTGESLYNGEIFDIIATENIRLKTPLNKLKYTPSYFDGQILTVRRINDINGDTYEIIHIDNKIINKTRNQIKYREKKKFYLSLLSAYIKFYPLLDYGYCISVYKSQGSEWNNVLINLNSIKWCIINQNKKITIKDKKRLFKTTYTAISRASKNVKLFWM